MWQCLEKVAAIASGCVVAAGTGQIDTGTAVGSVVAAAGLVGFFGEKRARHGPESTSYLAKIRFSVMAELGDPPAWPGADAADVEGWDWSLGEALPQSMLDRSALARAIFDRSGFPVAATELVVAELAVREPIFSHSPAQDFARKVIWAALTAAYEDKAYFDTLAPYLWSALGQKVDDISAGVAELLAIARQGGIFRQAAAHGISEEAVRRIVERLGGHGVAKADLLGWLEGWIAAAQAALGRHSNEGAAFEAAHREAERLFREGRGAAASAPFMALLEQERAEAERRQLAVLDKAIEFDLLGLDVDAAIDKLKRVRGICTGRDADGIAALYDEQAERRYEEGCDTGSNIALLFSIAACRLALEERKRERVPLDWAGTQNNLGNALSTLGERESGTARLEEAVVAYLLALEEQTRKRAPLRWAMTQNNLGTVFHALGERESGTVRLEEAVLAYRLALEERTRERVPLEWARTQNNLGNTLLVLGESESGAALLEEAVSAYRLALEEQTREHAPLQWAKTQNNLGVALRVLGERERGAADLEEAVSAHRLALEEQTRERVPFEWAMTQNNLGIALQALGAREGGTVRLEEAVSAYRLALEELTAEEHPYYWQIVTDNLTETLALIEERRGG